jgi:hypothetical protein
VYTDDNDNDFMKSFHDNVIMVTLQSPLPLCLHIQESPFDYHQ